MIPEPFHCDPTCLICRLLDESRKFRDLLDADNEANRIASDCHDPGHDERSCPTCEARLDAIDDYRIWLKRSLFGD